MPTVPTFAVRETDVSRTTNVGTWLRKCNGGQKYIWSTCAGSTLSDRLVSLGHPWNTSEHHGTTVLRGLREAWIRPPWCRETLVLMLFLQSEHLVNEIHWNTFQFLYQIKRNKIIQTISLLFWNYSVFSLVPKVTENYYHKLINFIWK